MAYLKSNSLGTFEEFISDERLKMLFGKREVKVEKEDVPIEDICDICGREFSSISGRFLSDGRKCCWRCRLRDISEEKRREMIEAEKDKIESRYEILDLRKD